MLLRLDLGKGRRQGPQTLEGVPGRSRAAGIGDHLVDGAERAGKDDRASHHPPGRHVRVDDEVGAQRQDPRLQHQSRRFGDGAEDAGLVGEVAGVRYGVHVAAAPALAEIVAHAHRRGGLGVAARVHEQAHRRRRRLGHVVRAGLGGHLVHDAEQHEQERSCDRHGRERRMHDIEDGEVEGYPGQIQQRRRTRAHQEIADRRKVLQRIMLAGVRPEMQRQPQRRHKQRGGEPVVEGDAYAGHELSAQPLEEAVKAVEQQRQQTERNQRRHALAGQDLVIDQHHEQRASQHQHVAEAADAAEAQQWRAQAADSLAYLLVGALARLGRAGMRFHGGRSSRFSGRRRASCCAASSRTSSCAVS